MAIITDFISDRGYVYRNQYGRVEEAKVMKTKIYATFGFYESQHDAEQNECPHSAEILSGDFDLNSNLNVWEQAYAIAKIKWPNSADV